jgi:DNA polymerase I
MAEDCYSTARLYPIFRDKMDEESERLWKAHQTFDLPAAEAFADIRRTGAPIDIKYLKTTKKEIEGHLEEEMLDIRAVVAELTNHHEIRKEDTEFNPNSSDQVKQVLYNAGDEGGLGLVMPKGVGRYAYKRDENKLTTNADTLKVLARQVAKENPAAASLINAILSFRVRSKILGTYVEGILQRVDPDGCVRGDLNLHGTATARISSSNPNLQNIPDASHVGYDVRKAYYAPRGWTLLDADMSQLELRVAALFSQDEVMLEAYRNGADIHQEVALMLWNKQKAEITKYERYLAKCMNFGVIYGRGVRSIATGPEMDNLVEMSGRSWNNKEIDAYFAKFKQGYGQLFEWMNLVKKDSMSKAYVETPTGHRRRFDLILPSERGHIERQMVNTPIQGFAARMVVHALVELWHKFDPETQRILFTVHDSILCMCKNKVVAKTKRLIKETMESALPEVTMTLPVLDHSPFKMGDPLQYNIPFVADVAVGPNWGDCHEDSDHVVVPTGSDEDALARVA